MMRAGIVPATVKVKARRKGVATGVGESARALEFNCYILPVFADTRLLAVGTKELNDFRISLLQGAERQELPEYHRR